MEEVWRDGGRQVRNVRLRKRFCLGLELAWHSPSLTSPHHSLNSGFLRAAGRQAGIGMHIAQQCVCSSESGQGLWAKQAGPAGLDAAGSWSWAVIC